MAEKIRSVCRQQGIDSSIAMNKVSARSLVLCVPGIHDKDDHECQGLTGAVVFPMLESRVKGIFLVYPLNGSNQCRIGHLDSPGDLFQSLYPDGISVDEIPNLLTEDVLHPASETFEKIKKSAHLLIMLDLSQKYKKGVAMNLLEVAKINIFVVSPVVINTQGLTLTREHRQTIAGALQHYADELMRLYDVNHYLSPRKNNVPTFRTAADIIKRLEEMEAKYQSEQSSKASIQFAASLHELTGVLKSTSAATNVKEAAVDNLRRSIAFFESTQTKEQNTAFKKGDKHLIKKFEFEFEMPGSKYVRDK